jgi:hypothetical protein
MVPDPANLSLLRGQEFPSPYACLPIGMVNMGNQWVSAVDPDGRAVNFLISFLISATHALFTLTSKAILASLKSVLVIRLLVNGFRDRLYNNILF